MTMSKGIAPARPDAPVGGVGRSAKRETGAVPGSGTKASSSSAIELTCAAAAWSARDRAPSRSRSVPSVVGAPPRAPRVPRRSRAGRSAWSDSGESAIAAAKRGTYGRELVEGALHRGRVARGDPQDDLAHSELLVVLELPVARYGAEGNHLQRIRIAPLRREVPRRRMGSAAPNPAPPIGIHPSAYSATPRTPSAWPPADQGGHPRLLDRLGPAPAGSSET